MLLNWWYVVNGLFHFCKTAWCGSPVPCLRGWPYGCVFWLLFEAQTPKTGISWWFFWATHWIFFCFGWCGSRSVSTGGKDKGWSGRFGLICYVQMWFWPLILIMINNSVRPTQRHRKKQRKKLKVATTVLVWAHFVAVTAYFFFSLTFLVFVFPCSGSSRLNTLI